MKTLGSIFLLLIFGTAMSQNNSVVLNGGFINVNNGAYFVVNQPNALGFVRTAGAVISENETNRVVWVINNSTGTYTVPFGTAVDYLPFTFQVTGAGSTPGSLIASTYRTPSTNAPFPTGVANLGSIFSGTDLTVADRFWVLGKQTWATEPTVSLTFTYADIEFAAPNTIVEANLKAQYHNGTNWNTTPLTGGLLGNDVPASNWVTGVVPPAGAVFRPWLVVDYTLPLPVELLSFSGECSAEGNLITWSTATETNNDYFTIEKSSDMSNWSELTTIAGTGNSTVVNNYQVIDPNPSEIMYYRLNQTDYNGSTKTYNTIVVKCGSGSEQSYEILSILYDQQSEFSVTYTSEINTSSRAMLYDATGRLIAEKKETSAEGVNQMKLDVSDLATGLYMFVFESNQQVTTRKFYIR
ncbi:MAG: T9SS type A sorting domain-containing protein [Bacteroidota bacterium]